MADSSVWIDVGNGEFLPAVFALGVEWLAPDLLLYELRTTPSRADLLARGVSSTELSGAQVGRLLATARGRPRLSHVDIAAALVALDEAAILLTGDAALRALAEEWGLEVHGTLWLLDRLVEFELVPKLEAATALERICAAGGRLPADEVASRLARWRR
ncbi:MAG: hypothetical protein M5U13_14180 [Thermoanaerobaculia bacterium]|nr:hypothetical protein [Thermoanaerobaculia bacterium]